MRNSYALAAAMVALASTATAASFDGFYAGAQLGHNATNVKIKESTTPITLDGMSATGAEYGVHAGYAKTFGNNFNLSGEVELAKSNAELSLNVANLAAAKITKEHSYGAAVRAGYVMGNVMPYARVGMTRAKFEAQGAGTEDYKKSGLALGAGLEWAVADAVSLRGEFVRTNYSKITEGTETYEPTENLARVGVSVRF